MGVSRMTVSLAAIIGGSGLKVGRPRSFAEIKAGVEAARLAADAPKPGFADARAAREAALLAEESPRVVMDAPRRPGVTGTVNL